MCIKSYDYWKVVELSPLLLLYTQTCARVHSLPLLSDSLVFGHIPNVNKKLCILHKFVPLIRYLAMKSYSFVEAFNSIYNVAITISNGHQFFLFLYWVNFFHITHCNRIDTHLPFLVFRSFKKEKIDCNCNRGRHVYLTWERLL